MLNKNTRRLSKMPDEVRGEIGPHFNNDRSAITEEQGEKLAKPGNKVNDPSTKQFIRKGLTVSRLDILIYACLFY
jgi:fatty acyl-ACP thioesterase B